MVDEVVKGLLLERWGALAPSTGDPVTALQRVLRRRAANLTSREVELGCPLNNLAQEMSPLDERFRRRVERHLRHLDPTRWPRTSSRGQAEGTVRQDLDPRKVAAFVVASIEGSFGLAKGAQSATLLRSNLKLLGAFLDTLRPAPGRRPSPPQTDPGPTT